MINLQFEVNKVALLIAGLRYIKFDKYPILKDSRFEQLTKLLEFPSHKALSMYRNIFDNPELMNLIEKEIFTVDIFQVALKETVLYKKYLEEICWKKNKTFLQDYIEKVLGITEKFDVKVNVLNPRLMIGCSNLAGESFFGMRHRDPSKNVAYNTVYLLHEALHSYLPYNKEWNDDQRNVSHAVIQLATDNELWKRFGINDFEYGTIGHDSVIPVQKRMVPLWNSYLEKKANPEKSNNKELDAINNIRDFHNYCIEHYKDYLPKRDMDIE